MNLRLASLLLLAGCGSVPLPEERFYRLALPPPAVAAHAGAGVLRIDRPHLAASLAGDTLLVAEDDVTLRPYLFHRWAAPLEALVADELVTYFARSHCFTEVKAATDPGTEDLVLGCRVLELHQVVDGGVWQGRVTLALRLTREGRVVRELELQRAVPAGERTPEAVVRALGQAFGEILGRTLVAIGDAAATAPVVESAPIR